MEKSKFGQGVGKASAGNVHSIGYQPATGELEDPSAESREVLLVNVLDVQHQRSDEQT